MKSCFNCIHCHIEKNEYVCHLNEIPEVVYYPNRGCPYNIEKEGNNHDMLQL